MKKITQIWHTTMMVMLMTILWAFAPAAAQADDEAYVRLDGETITFYYDDGKQDGDYALDLEDKTSGEAFPEWITMEEDEEAFATKFASVTCVKFDKSFSKARPVLCHMWFSGMKNLTTIYGIENLNTEETKDMIDLFEGCSSLTTLDLTHFNTAKVNATIGMFEGCSLLNTITVSKGFTLPNLQEDCSEDMFKGCSALTGYGADKTDATYATWGDNGYLTLYVGPYVRYTDTDKTLTFYYGEDRLPNDYTLEPIDEQGSPQWRPVDEEGDVDTEDDLNVTRVVFDESFSKARPKITNLWFYQMNSLASIEGMEYLNTSEVTEMMGMFAGCYELATIDLSRFNTENVTDMTAMFSQCRKLTTLDLSHFNTEKVTNMKGMFQLCDALTFLDCSTFNTSQVEDMSYMFSLCTALKTIYVSDKFTAESGNNIFASSKNLKGAISYEEDNDDQTYANYATGYFTKKVGTNGTDIIGATGSTLTIEDLTVEDGKSIALTEDCQAKSASYTRTMSSKWGTLCLPFAIDATAEGNTCYFYNLKEVGDESVTLSKIEGTIEAGTPVVVCKKTDNQTDITIQATDAAVVKSPVSSTETTCLAGTFEGEILQTGGYFIAKNMFFNVNDYAEKGVKVNPYRAYIKTGSNVNSAMLTIIDADEPTGIHAIDTPEDTTVAPEYYDATGHRIPTLQRGLNIVKRGSKTLKVLIK